MVGHTWQYVNKDGGPDRRYSNNPQIARVLHGEIQIKSASGLNEYFQTSKSVAAAALDAAIKGQLGAGALSKGKVIATLITPNDVT